MKCIGKDSEPNVSSVNDVEQRVTDYLVFAKENYDSKPDLSLIYCRKSLECILKERIKFFVDIDASDIKKMNASQMIKVLDPHIPNHVIGLMFSITNQTNPAAHDNPEFNPTSSSVKATIETIKAVFSDLYDQKLSIDAAILSQEAKQNLTEIGFLDVMEEALPDHFQAIRESQGEEEEFDATRMLEDIVRRMTAEQVIDDYFDAQGRMSDPTKTVGDVAKAIENTKQVLALFTECGDINLEAKALLFLSILYEMSGSLDLAEEILLNQCIPLQEELRLFGELAASHQNLALIAQQRFHLDECKDMRHIDKIMDCYNTAVSFAENHGDQQWTAVIKTNYASMLSNYTHEHHKQRNLWTECLKLNREVGDRKNEAKCLRRLAGIFHQIERDNESFLRLAKQAQRIYSELGEPEADIITAAIHSWSNPEAERSLKEGKIQWLFPWEEL